MSQKKYVSLSKLSVFLDNLSNKFAKLTHTHKLSDITDYTVDAELSSTSTNPIQNKVVDAELDAVATAMGALEQAIDGKSDSVHTHSIEDVDNLQVTLDEMKADHDWIQIYDSGEITEAVNSIAGIDISGYNNIQVAVQNTNDGTNTTSAAGAVVFTAQNGTTYLFHTWQNLFYTTNGNTTSGLAHFKILNEWIMMEHVATSANQAKKMLTETEGGSAFKCSMFSGGGLIRCTNELATMAVTSQSQSASNFFGVGSRVIVWGCKV